MTTTPGTRPTPAPMCDEHHVLLNPSGFCPKCDARSLAFPAMWAELREQVERDAATHQELGDGYSDKGGDIAELRAQNHWGRAAALREVLADMDRIASRAQEV